MIKKCIECGKEFKTIPHGTKRKYCSTKCQYKHLNKAARDHAWYLIHREKLLAKPREITCKRCGKIFMGKYCQKYCIPCLEYLSVHGHGSQRQYLENRKDYIGDFSDFE